MDDDMEQLRYGYWPHRQLTGDIPSPIRSPADYKGGRSVNIACTQTGLTVSRQRRLVAQWVNDLPNIPAETVVFSSKVSQNLLDAACAAPNLRALSIKWSSAQSLDGLRSASKLQSLFLGSSPSISDLRPFAAVHHLRHLFIENVAGPIDLDFLRPLDCLKELGLSGARRRKVEVLSLEPVASKSQIEMLWLVRVRIINGGLRPLHSLSNLKSLRTTIRHNSPEFKELCSAIPTLQLFQPVA